MRLAPNRPLGADGLYRTSNDVEVGGLVDPFQLAAVLAAVVLLASVLSVELGVTVALLELTLGVIAGNLFIFRPKSGWTSSPSSRPSS